MMLLTISHETKGSTVCVADRLPPDTNTIDAVVVKNCPDIELDLTGVKFHTNTIERLVERPMVEVWETSPSVVVKGLTHVNDYDAWLQLDWRNARNGILLRSEGGVAFDCILQGVRHGIAALKQHCEIQNCSVDGFSADAVRLLESYIKCSHVVIQHAFWGDEREHSDALQMFPVVLPDEQKAKYLQGIVIDHVSILNRSNSHPMSRWMQGIILSDGVLCDSSISNVTIDTDHEIGVHLAEAHDVTLRNVDVRDSCIKIGTAKEGYNASSNVRMTENIKALEIIIL